MTTKSDIIAAVASGTGNTQATTKTIIDAAVDTIAAALVAGEKVQIAGLGTFTVKPTEARTARNPRDGSPVEIEAGFKISFKTASDLKAKF